MKCLNLVFTAALLATVGSVAHAQDSYPSKPIKIVVPFSPGGAVDGPTRAIAQQLSKQLKQQVIVENKPGAGATVGSEAVARSAPDGYTLLLASATNAIQSSLYPKLTYKPIEDFVGISLLGHEPGVLVVIPSLPVKTVAELVALAKAKPTELNYASSGNGTGQHLFMAQFASMAEIKLTHVPYKGSGQATTDLLAGQVSLSMPGTAGMVGHIKNGKLRALAVTGDTRAPQLPDVPTLKESGYPDYVAYVWMGLLAPKGTPDAIIQKLNAELKIALKTPEVREFMTRTGIEALGSSPAEMDAYFREERDRWSKVVKDTGAKVE